MVWRAISIFNAANTVLDTISINSTSLPLHGFCPTNCISFFLKQPQLDLHIARRNWVFGGRFERDETPVFAPQFRYNAYLLHASLLSGTTLRTFSIAILPPRRCLYGVWVIGIKVIVSAAAPGERCTGEPERMSKVCKGGIGWEAIFACKAITVATGPYRSNKQYYSYRIASF